MRRRLVPGVIGAVAAALAIALLTVPFPHSGVLALVRAARPHSTAPVVVEGAWGGVKPYKAVSRPRPALDGLRSASWNRPCGLIRHPRPIHHVIWIWFENQDPAHALGGSTTSALAARCGSTSSYFGLTHPSLPNYLAAVSGSTQGIVKNCFCSVSAPSLMFQVASWRLYAESMPSNCDPTDDLPYQAHHNVALHFQTIDCADNDVPLTQLMPDLRAGDLPEFSFILPNGCHSMHFAKVGCNHRLTRKLAIRSGNTWLHTLLTPILDSRTYRNGDTAIFIAWDEGQPVIDKGEHCLKTLSPDCQTSVIAIAPSVVPGTTATTLYDPYSLLRTTEALLRLPLLGRAHSAHGMRSAFNL